MWARNAWRKKCAMRRGQSARHMIWYPVGAGKGAGGAGGIMSEEDPTRLVLPRPRAVRLAHPHGMHVASEIVRKTCAPHGCQCQVWVRNRKFSTTDTVTYIFEIDSRQQLKHGRMHPRMGVAPQEQRGRACEVQSHVVDMARAPRTVRRRRKRVWPKITGPGRRHVLRGMPHPQGHWPRGEYFGLKQLSSEGGEGSIGSVRHFHETPAIYARDRSGHRQRRSAKERRR